MGLQIAIGIDISKRKFDLALLRDGKFKHKTFSNSNQGYQDLRRWLSRLKVTKARVCMESTSTYGQALAEYLHDHDYVVSIVNPARIKGFAQSELCRTKTDKTDAALIARFCLAMAPEPWTPDAREIRALRALVRRLDNLLGMRQQEVNRLHVAQDIVVSDLEEHIAYLDQEIKTTRQRIRDHTNNNPDLKHKKKLLASIPGIGEATIHVVLSEFSNIEKFRNAKCLATFIGVAPRERRSGTSVRGRTVMSKIGRSQLRKALFMPAMVALRYNPILMDMKQRLTKAGKSKMAIIGAAMRKLVHLIYGILKSGMPFDPDFATKRLDG